MKSSHLREGSWWPPSRLDGVLPSIMEETSLPLGGRLNILFWVNLFLWDAENFHPSMVQTVKKQKHREQDKPAESSAEQRLYRRTERHGPGRLHPPYISVRMTCISIAPPLVSAGCWRGGKKTEKQIEKTKWEIIPTTPPQMTSCRVCWRLEDDWFSITAVNACQSCRCCCRNLCSSDCIF